MPVGSQVQEEQVPEEKRKATEEKLQSDTPNVKWLPKFHLHFQQCNTSLPTHLHIMVAPLYQAI
jgi:hypothetical protein